MQIYFNVSYLILKQKILKYLQKREKPFHCVISFSYDHLICHLASQSEDVTTGSRWCENKYWEWTWLLIDVENVSHWVRNLVFLWMQLNFLIRKWCYWYSSLRYCMDDNHWDADVVLFLWQIRQWMIQIITQ